MTSYRAAVQSSDRHTSVAISYYLETQKLIGHQKSKITLIISNNIKIEKKARINWEVSNNATYSNNSEESHHITVDPRSYCNGIHHNPTIFPCIQDSTKTYK